MITVSEPGHLIFVAWNMQGLQICEDLTQAEKNHLFDLIKGSSNYESWLKHLIMCAHIQAQGNSHKNYEIYTITLSPGLTVDDLVLAFEHNSQYIINWIRQQGHPGLRGLLGLHRSDLNQSVDRHK